MRYSTALFLALVFLSPKPAFADTVEHMARMPMNTVVQEAIEKCNPKVNTLIADQEGTYRLDCRRGRDLTIEVIPACPPGTGVYGMIHNRRNGRSQYIPYCGI